MAIKRKGFDNQNVWRGEKVPSRFATLVVGLKPSAATEAGLFNGGADGIRDQLAGHT